MAATSAKALDHLDPHRPKRPSDAGGSSAEGAHPLERDDEEKQALLADACSTSTVEHRADYRTKADRASILSAQAQRSDD